MLTTCLALVSLAATASPDVPALARRAAADAEAALERATRILNTQLRLPPGREPLTVVIYRDGAQLPVIPVYGPRALELDAPAKARLRQTGQVLRFTDGATPRYLLAVESNKPRRRALGLRIPASELGRGLAASPGLTLALLDPAGGVLAGTRPALDPAGLELVRGWAGHGAATGQVGTLQLAYAPVGPTRTGVLAGFLPAATVASPTPAPLASPLATPSVSTPPVPWLGYGLGTAAGLGLVIGLLAWLRRRWANQLAPGEAPRSGRSTTGEIARLVSGVAGNLPELRLELQAAMDMLATLDRAPAGRLGELGTDLAEQAANLHERLVQASARPAAPAARSWEQAALALQTLATQVLVNAAKVERTEVRTELAGLGQQAAEIARQMRQHLEDQPAGTWAPTLGYVTELAGALKERSTQLEARLGTAQEEDEARMAQLASIHHQVERARLSIEVLGERVAALDQVLRLLGD